MPIISVGLVNIFDKFSGSCFKKLSTPVTINKAKNENIIKFNPTPPPSPHSEEDHEYIETFDKKLHELMDREEE